jgi:HAD superfamily hydrolase (TIGR01509 family)
MIKWVFFDVGNVLLNDDPLMAERFRMLYEAVRAAGHNVSFEQLCRQREQLILEERESLYFLRICAGYLTEQQKDDLLRAYDEKFRAAYLRYSPPTPGIEAVLKALKQRFKLGLAANQVRECRGALEELGWLDYFDVVGISEEMGIGKPAEEFFQCLLEEGQCRPTDAIMIGDRVDNDVAPAKAVGMKTICVLMDVWSKGYEPADGFEKRYFESMHRACLSRLGASGNHQQPDVLIHSISEIPDAVKRIAGA